LKDDNQRLLLKYPCTFYLSPPFVDEPTTNQKNFLPFYLVRPPPYSAVIIAPKLSGNIL
jgi:hypothetical protein